MAAAMASVSCGIGKLFGDIGDPSSGMVDLGNTGTQEIARAAAHGVSGGVAEQINGGSFGTGFAASFVGSAAGSAMGTGPAAKFFEGQDTAAVFKRTVAVAIIGGTTAEIGGGKFANGAMTSAFQSLGNELGARASRHLKAERVRARYNITFESSDGERNSAFEEAVLLDIASIVETPTESGVNYMIDGSLSNDTLPGLTIVYGENEYVHSGGRKIYLNTNREQGYMDNDQYRLRYSQHETTTGPRSSAIVLAHELGHALVPDLGEFGACTFFENQYRAAFGVPNGFRNTYNGTPLNDLTGIQSDKEDYNDWASIYSR